MESNKRYYLISLYILLLLAAITAAYFFFIRNDQAQENIDRAIPVDAVIILKTESVSKLWHTLNKTSQWTSLRNTTSFQSIHQGLNYLDSISSQNSKASAIFSQQPFSLSLLLNNEKLRPLFVFALESTRQKKPVLNYIKELSSNNSPNETTYLGYKVYSTKLKNIDKQLFYIITKGLLIFSFDLDIVKQSLDQLESNTSLLADESFQKIVSTAGKKVEANLYVNNSRFLQTLQSSLNTNIDAESAFTGFAAGWTVLDLNIKDKEILLNGFSGSANQQADFLQLFKGKEPQNSKILSVLPSNTLFFFTIGANNFSRYFEGIQKFDGDVDSSEAVNRLSNNQEILQLIGQELAFVYTEPPGLNIADYGFLVVNSSDSELLKEKIKNATAAIPAGTYSQKDIFEIKNTNPLTFLFDPLVKSQSMPYYTALGEWLIFAHDVAGLKKFINYFNTGRTLERNQNYQEFSDNIAESSNVYLYLNLRIAKEFINSALGEEFKEFIFEGYDTYKLFEGPAIQFSSIKDLFYTNVYFRYNPTITKEDIFLWQTTLDTSIRQGPILVNNHSSEKQSIIAIDWHNTMYMIDPEGEIAWTRSFTDTIQSDLHEIDFYRNNKVQYIFNTSEHIYLIDINGKDVAGYPIKLGSPATNGLSVFDYAGTKNYRIFIACEDNRIYNLNKLGGDISGWKSPKLTAPMSRELQRLVINNKDYLIMALDNGNVFMTNRKGKNRLTIKKSFVNSTKSAFYKNMTNSKGMMITTNVDGKLMYIPGAGSVSSTSFGDFVNEPWFIYEDIDKDGNNDFIFFDQSDLYIMNRLKETLMHHEFNFPIETKPQILKIKSGEKFIAITDNKNAKVYLFNINGYLDWSIKIKGDTPVSIGTLNDDGEINLFVGYKNVIYNYQFE